jgi:hypothetical protein
MSKATRESVMEYDAARRTALSTPSLPIGFSLSKPYGALSSSDTASLVLVDQMGRLWANYDHAFVLLGRAT